MRTLMIGFCLCLALLTSCDGGKPREDRYPDVKMGMTESEVEALLGKPDSTADADGKISKTWKMDVDKRVITITFKDGKVEGKSSRG